MFCVTNVKWLRCGAMRCRMSDACTPDVCERTAPRRNAPHSMRCIAMTRLFVYEIRLHDRRNHMQYTNGNASYMWLWMRWRAANWVYLVRRCTEPQATQRNAPGAVYRKNLCPQVTFSDVKSSRPSWPRGQNIVDVSVGLWTHGRALQYRTRWLFAVAWQSCQHPCRQSVLERTRQWGSNIRGTAHL